jgi:hypothetical protein
LVTRVVVVALFAAVALGRTLVSDAATLAGEVESGLAGLYAGAAASVVAMQPDGSGRRG